MTPHGVALQVLAKMEAEAAAVAAAGSLGGSAASGKPLTGR